MEEGQLREIAFQVLAACARPGGPPPKLVNAIHNLITVCDEILREVGINTSYKRTLPPGWGGGGEDEDEPEPANGGPPHTAAPLPPNRALTHYWKRRPARRQNVPTLGVGDELILRDNLRYTVLQVQRRPVSYVVAAARCPDRLYTFHPYKGLHRL